MADWYKAGGSKEAKETQEDTLKFNSRRSPVVCRNGCVSSSQVSFERQIVCINEVNILHENFTNSSL